MRNGIDSIHMARFPLPQAVPVNGSTVFPQFVLDFDFYSVAPTSLNPGTRQATIEKLHWNGSAAVGIKKRVRELDGVGPNYACGTIGLVVCMNVETLASLGVFQPAVSVRIVVAGYLAIIF